MLDKHNNIYVDSTYSACGFPLTDGLKYEHFLANLVHSQ